MQIFYFATDPDFVCIFDLECQPSLTSLNFSAGT